MEMGKLDTRTGSEGTEKSSARRVSAPPRPMDWPLEWMDGSSWRLPSGKALAEFALQAGFLAPLMLGKPRWAAKPPAKKSAEGKRG